MNSQNNYVECIAPSITINDEPYINHALDQQIESNNNLPVIDSSTGGSYHDHNDQINGNFMCLSNNTIDLYEIPITALRQASRDILSKRLRAIKVLLSENGAPRDWRGILSGIGLSDAIHTLQATSQDPMKDVLELWLKERKDIATIGKLRQILGDIDRWDVVDDTNEFFAEDANIYLAKYKNKPAPLPQQDNIQIDENNDILTNDDAFLASQGLPPQKYDGFLLFHDYDIDFAARLLEKMESEYNLKLCTKERDLIGGTIADDTIMRVISERCNRLIVIFSKPFFDSPSNTFFVKFAQFLGIHQRTRKIIPCVSEACQLPLSLSCYHTLWYREEVTPYFNFWEKLHRSIVPVNQISSPDVLPRITITEVKSASPVPAIECQPQPQQAIVGFETPNTPKRKGKEKSKSPKSSLPTTPTSLKKFWLNFPKIGSQTKLSSSSSAWALNANDQIFDKENDRCKSSLSLNNGNLSSTPTKDKKNKWYKNLLSPASAQKQLSAESDSSVGADSSTVKKKKWYRKKLRSLSKNREAVAEI